MGKNWVVLPLFSLLAFASCIQDEPLCAECDIESASVEIDDSLVTDLFYAKSYTSKEVASSDSVIVFYLRDGLSDDSLLKALPVSFSITAGATISPESGSVQDFSNGGVRYTVTSEDGNWHREYVVKFAKILLVTDLSFEHFTLESGERYYEWYEETGDGDFYQWASGNPGYAISRSSAGVEDYPTLPWSEESVSGYCVKLETCDTGPFGRMVNMRIAAGNLFIGSFDVTNALKDAMAATRFGRPFNRTPRRFQGYYKYKPGDEFQNRKGVIQDGVIDEPDLYAVLYKNTDDTGASFTLQGDNVLTHENIAALARVQNPVHDFDNWTYYDIEFEYSSEIDKDLLDNYGYNLAVVFTSSIEGASFEGAIGSTLLVDEVKVVCDEDE